MARQLSREVSELASVIAKMIHGRLCGWYLRQGCVIVWQIATDQWIDGVRVWTDVVSASFEYLEFMIDCGESSKLRRAKKFAERTLKKMNQQQIKIPPN
jgi:hypothetical protein